MSSSLLTPISCRTRCAVMSPWGRRGRQSGSDSPLARDAWARDAGARRARPAHRYRPRPWSPLPTGALLVVRIVLQQPVEGCRGIPELASRRAPGEVPGCQLGGASWAHLAGKPGRSRHRRAPNSHATSGGMPHPFAYAICDQLTLHLGDGSQDGEHEPARSLRSYRAQAESMTRSQRPECSRSFNVESACSVDRNARSSFQNHDAIHPSA